MYMRKILRTSTYSGSFEKKIRSRLIKTGETPQKFKGLNKIERIFNIEIKETLSKTISISAKNESEAIWKIKKKYDKESIVLDSSDFQDVEFCSSKKRKLAIGADLKTMFVFCLPDENQKQIKQLLENSNLSQETISEAMTGRLCDLEDILDISYKNNLSSLPNFCYSLEKGTGDLVVIKNGEKGYFFTDYNSPGQKERNFKRADFLNEKLGLSKREVAIMVKSSMTSWDKEHQLLNPELYDDKRNNKYITPSQEVSNLSQKNKVGSLNKR